MSRKKLSFEEGKKIVDGRGDYAYNVQMLGSEGDLMSRSDYEIGVDDEFFTDYDGYGLQVNAEGGYIDNTRPANVDMLDSKCAYVLWFNK